MAIHRQEEPELMVRDHARFFSGPFAMTAGCHYCRHTEVVRRHPRPGRGWGWRARNELTRRMRRHLEAEHPERIRKQKETP